MKKLFLLTIIQSILFCSYAQNWFEIEIDTDAKLNAIDFPSSSVGYIGGDSALLFKTTDGGQSWNEVSHSGLTTSIFHSIIELQFVSEEIGFASTNSANGVFFKTVDGGVNWTSIDTMTNGFCFVDAMYMFNETNGVFGGKGCFSGSIIERLNNNSFEPTNITMQNGVYLGISDIDFWDENNGIAASRSKYFYRTTDGGETWDTIPTDLTSGRTSGVRYVSQDTLVASYSNQIVSYGILVSTDGGLTWEQNSSSATFFYPDYNCVAKNNQNKIYVGAKNSNNTEGVIFTSTSVTNSWMYDEVPQPIYDIDSYGQDVTFAVGDSGLVLVNQELTVGISKLDELNSNITVYPNPANEIVTISSDEVITELKLFKLSGQLVLEENDLNASQTKLDLSQIPTGVYVVSIDTSEGVAHKKLIVE